MFATMVLLWRCGRRKSALVGVITVSASLACLSLRSPGAESTPASDPFVHQLQPFLNEYCVSCHGREKQRAEVDLERWNGTGGMADNRDLWEKVRKAIESREMPPDHKPQPEEAVRLKVMQAIQDEAHRVDALTPPMPGAVTLRRLNRNEYRNTVRDLLAVDYDTHAEFPHDESGYGFDNIGDVLSLPPMLLEKYLAAAEEIARRAIQTEDPARRRIQRIAANRFATTGDSISTQDNDVWAFYREGTIGTDYEFAAAGEYVLRLTAYGEQAGPELPRLGVLVDDRQILAHAVKATEGRPETVEVPLQIESPGRRKLGAAYLNNFNADGDRNLFLVAFEVVGPLGGPVEAYPESHRRVLPERPPKGKELAYVSEALRSFLTRAYRRPAKDAEVTRLVGLVEAAMKDGETVEQGVQLAVQAVLVSPHFLFRWELDPAVEESGVIRELNDWEVASRLSYFLWSTMPDAELMARAAEGTLRKPEVLEAQVRRMLRDPKTEALVQNFGGQWLQTRNLDEVEPDPTAFPNWGPELRQAMKRETDLFLQAVIHDDLPARALIEADFTYLNERLAKHYGVDGIRGDEFRRVALPPDSPRGGVLTLGSVLTVTSVPTRTAPVLRGKWILEQILGTPPPPPPPNVPQIEEGAEAEKSATLRQRLELHRSKPDCMTCHQKMDPLGFALENFDGIGGWRLQDGPHPVDTSAELPNGTKITGAPSLKEVLKASPDFPRALASKLLTYALGRGLEPYDRRTVQKIVEGAQKNDFKFSALVLEIVSSDPFLKRQPQFAQHEVSQTDDR